MKKRDSFRWNIFFAVIIIIAIITAISMVNKNQLTGLASFERLSVFILNNVGRIFISINFDININLPMNATYNFDIYDNYTIALNVSSNRNITTWKYTLLDWKHGGIVVNESVIFTPNTTIRAVKGSNELIVLVNDSVGNSKNSSVIFFVNTTNAPPQIENISGNIYVCEGNYLSYFFNVTDINEEVPTILMTPLDPFYAVFSSNVNYTVNKYEIFSGILSKTNAGGVNARARNYTESIFAVDNVSVDQKSINITVIEINNAPVIQDIGVKTIWTRGDNSTFSYNVSVTDTEDGNQNSGNLSFNISFSGTRLFNITSTGSMNFSGNQTFIGVHNITVCITDRGLANPHNNISLCSQTGGNRTSCNNFSLTVTNTNRNPNITSYSPTNLTIIVLATDTSHFNITMYDPDGTIPDSYWYADNSLKETNSGSLIDNFDYSFGCGSSGNHTIKVVISDGELNSSIQWNLTVTAVACSESSGGGGGGGGGQGAVCNEKWGCKEWSECKKIEAEPSLSKLYKLFIKERCSLLKINEMNCGFQVRECTDIKQCKTNKTRPGFIQECYYVKYPDCHDGIKNCHDENCEIMVDCGGPCSPCLSCSDKIQNQGEEEVDCGGPCKPCLKEIPKKAISFMVYIFIIIFVLFLIIILKLARDYYLKKIRYRGIELKK